MFEFVHKYITVIGDAYGGAEHWQFGLRALSVGAPTPSNQACADVLKPIVQAWYTDSGAQAGSEFGAVSSHRLTEVKVAEIGLDGQYVPNSIAASAFYSPAIAGVAAPQSGTAPQNTLAVTLTTARPRGLASKGRIFPPPSSYMAIASATGKIPDPNATRIRNSIRTLINAINATAELGPVMVMSKGRGVRNIDAVRNKIFYTYPNAGISEAVTAVRVGLVVDTQRRRRRQLSETPLSIAL